MLFVPLSETETRLLLRLQDLCEHLIEPGAEAVDQSGRVPRENLEAIARAGLIRAEASSEYKHALTETLCASCGTTWFVLTQHLGQCERLLRFGKPHLRALIPAMEAGEHWVGVGFGHLRRPQRMLTAQPVEGGWLLSGVAPWVTGWPILSGVVWGAWLPDDAHLYVYAPVESSPAIQAGPALPLCGMAATETVEVTLKSLFVPEENLLFLSSREVLMAGDDAAAAANVSPMLGVARGALRALEKELVKKPLPALAEAHAKLTEELLRCRAVCAAWAAKGAGAGQSGKDARAWAIDLGMRAAQVAFIAASGGANALTHPAQRRCREALFYSLYQQTGDLLSATALRLVRSPQAEVPPPPEP